MGTVEKSTDFPILTKVVECVADLDIVFSAWARPALSAPCTPALFVLLEGYGIDSMVYGIRAYFWSSFPVAGSEQRLQG
jgi:hypothetical protein